jgi:hypothetical protein
MNRFWFLSFIVLFDAGLFVSYGVWAAVDYEKDNTMSVEEKIEVSRRERDKKDRQICFPVSRCIDNSTGTPYTIGGQFIMRECTREDWKHTNHCYYMDTLLFILVFVMSVVAYGISYTMVAGELIPANTQPKIKLLIIQFIIILITNAMYWSISVRQLRYWRIYVLTCVAMVRLFQFTLTIGISKFIWPAIRSE